MGMEEAEHRMVAGEVDLKEIITTNGKMEQFTTLLEKEANENHVKKKLKYLEKMSGGLPYPKSVFFIVSNEFCERFSFYGMRAILSLYLHSVLNYSKDTSTVIYHMFLMAAYFFPLFGAIIADSFLGRFRTIFYLSVVYTIGNLTLSLSSSKFFGLPQREASMIGLFLIAFGTGGIKPCVSAFGGDQFVLPQQEKQLAQFFSIFYFSINAGSLLSTYVTPNLRHHVQCFGEDSCYPLAFGVPAFLMMVALVVFLIGTKFYVKKKPEGNIIIKVTSCISYALGNKMCGKGAKKSHWLNYAEDKFDTKLIEEIKSVLHVLLLFVPLPAFWALYDQQGSRWTFQATNMDGSLGVLGSIKPEQIQIINPLLILILIPLFETVIYPLLANFRIITSPLQKMSAGGLLTALSFIVSGLLELNIGGTYPTLPGNGLGQVRMFNGLNCPVSLASVSPLLQGNISAFDTLQFLNVPTDVLSKKPEFNVTSKCPSAVDRFFIIPGKPISKDTYQNVLWTGKIEITNDTENVALSYLITGDNSKIEVRQTPGYDDVQKSKIGLPKISIIYKVNNNVEVTLTSGKFKKTILLVQEGVSVPATELDSTSEHYNLNIGGKNRGELDIQNGGVYTLMIIENNNEYVTRLTTIQPPNTVHMLWQLPQYFIITAAEVMFSITGLQFSYSQAPTSMKSVLTAAWLLTTSLGNLIVIVIAEFQFAAQAVEFFAFAMMMLVVMAVFIYMANRYQYVQVPQTETNENASKRQPTQS